MSVSGAKLKNNRHYNIPDIATMMKDFVESQPTTASRVANVILSCGTNDIKHLRSRQLGPLYKSITDLVALTRKLFGQGVIISFQSVLPMRVMYDYTIENFLNFNRLLQTECSQYNCYYIDWFWHFLDYNGDDINLLFYSDSIHLNRRGISYLNKLFFELIRNRHLGRFSAFKF